MKQQCHLLRRPKEASFAFAAQGQLLPVSPWRRGAGKVAVGRAASAKAVHSGDSEEVPACAKRPAPSSGESLAVTVSALLWFEDSHHCN